MTELAKQCQPGPVFYDVFIGYLRVLGTNVKEWAVPHGVSANNAKLAATGGWNGTKARALRQEMIKTVGEATFVRLYEERMAIEQKRVA